jgi:hypothetical protein
MDVGTLEWEIAFGLKHRTHAYRKDKDRAPEIDALAIADHLRLAGWRFTRSEPARLHSWPPATPDP